MADLRRATALAAALLAAGCGARTIADEYRDGSVDRVTVPDRDAPPDVPETCPGSLQRCGDRCVDLTRDPQHCGACGSVCPASARCVGAACVGVACPSPLTSCGGVCVDTRSDPRNCGACGVSCGPARSCAAARCVTSCDPMTPTLCGARCTDVDSDPMNCGACGVACAPGQRCRARRCETLTMPAGGLEIVDLTSANCRTREHVRETGDDRGGIAVTDDQVLYTGDVRTVAFDVNSLEPRAQATRRFDGIFSFLAGSPAFTIASNLTPLDERTSILDALLPLSPELVPASRSLPLSRVIFADRSANDVGIFAGVRSTIITQGRRGWVIALGTNTVTELAIAPIGAHQLCETWAFWGVAESIGGEPWVAYVRDGVSIVRQNLMSGSVRLVASFARLSDMCSFTVSPSAGRWYFHHEGPSQFAAGDETIGYCDARVRLTP